MRSKSKQARKQNLAKAWAKNPKHNKSTDSFASESLLNTAMLDTQSESSDKSGNDETPNNSISATDFDSDETNASTESENSADPDFLPEEDKLMVIPVKFVRKLVKMLCCPECKEQGGIDPSVINVCGFFNDINFLCKCKHSFSVANFDDESINDALVRNLIVNGIPKQPFQRWLQVANFGAIMNGQEYGINLYTKNSMNTFEKQNDQIIKGAEEIHKDEMSKLHQANKGVTISLDGTYPKRGHHSPAGHAAMICNGKVIDARTVKRSSKPSENAFGDIVDKPANKLEAYTIVKMLKDAIPVIGPLIEQIDVDQDATIQDVIINLKWEPEDVGKWNKFTGRQEITEDMVGQSVWGGQIPQIHPDKVHLPKNCYVRLGFTILKPKRPCRKSLFFRKNDFWVWPFGFQDYETQTAMTKKSFFPKKYFFSRAVWVSLVYFD